MNSIHPYHHEHDESPRPTSSQEVSEDPATQLGLDYRLYQLVASDRWTWSKTWQMVVLRLVPALQIPLSGLGVALAAGTVTHDHRGPYGSPLSIMAGAGAVTVAVRVVMRLIRRRRAARRHCRTAEDLPRPG